MHPTLRRAPARRSLFVSLLLAGMLLLIGMCGTVGLLIGTGQIDVQRLAVLAGLAKETVPGPPPGSIPVPISARPIKAYTRVTREDLFDMQKRSLSVIYLTKEQITPEMLTSLPAVLGRVLDHDKPAGYVFTEADFLPKGTRPGLTAGIPPGKRAYRLQVSQITGVHDLQAGDHLDVIANVPLSASKSNTLVASSTGRSFDAPKQAEVRVVVNNGMVLSPVSKRMESVTSSSLTQGTTTRDKPIEEIVLAVDPEEVPRLSEAEALGFVLMAVARSGHPDEATVESVTPSLNPAAGRKTIETLRGNKRQVVVFDNGTKRVVDAPDRNSAVVNTDLPTSGQ